MCLRWQLQIQVLTSKITVCNTRGKLIVKHLQHTLHAEVVLHSQALYPLVKTNTSPGQVCLCGVCWPAHTSALPACHTAAVRRLSPPTARIKTAASPGGRCCRPASQGGCSPGWQSLGSRAGGEGRPPVPPTPRWHDGEEWTSCWVWRQIYSRLDTQLGDTIMLHPYDLYELHETVNTFRYKTCHWLTVCG